MRIITIGIALAVAMGGCDSGSTQAGGTTAKDETRISQLETQVAALQGQMGAKGDPGPKGDTGAMGAVGPKGDPGQAGMAGDPGAKGDPGPKGDVGPQGPAGAQGAQGAKGDTGAMGLAGAKGDPGAKGDKGDVGPSGDAGPSGVVVMFGGAAAPAGWLLCDGAAVSRMAYPSLFAAIGTTYGNGDGATTFNVPNLKGNVPVGLDAMQAEFATLGHTGGEKAHVLSINEMPSHSHRWGDTQAGGVTNNPGLLNNFNNTTGVPSRNTDSVGGGAAHNILQPYLTLNFIIKI